MGGGALGYFDNGTNFASPPNAVYHMDSKKAINWATKDLPDFKQWDAVEERRKAAERRRVLEKRRKAGKQTVVGSKL